jgi:hypothetical protein
MGLICAYQKHEDQRMRKSLMVAAAAAALTAAGPAQAAEHRATTSPQLQRPDLRLERIGTNRTRRQVTLRVRGRVLLPAGVKPEQGCSGAVAITVRRAGRSLATGGTQLRANCRFTRRISLSRRILGRARLLKVRAIFSGNAVLLSARRTRAVRIRQ